MSITLVCDLSTRSWSTDGEWDGIVSVGFTNGDDDPIAVENLAFGWSAAVGGSEVGVVDYPPSGSIYREIRPTHRFHDRLTVSPEDDVTVSVWVSNAGIYTSSEFGFVVPRPPSPFPSWVWEEGEWVAPVPYPEDGGAYRWDEDGQGWIPLAEA